VVKCLIDAKFVWHNLDGGSEMTPTVSIITPIYNASGLVKQFIAMISHQRLRDIELIMIDDGSSDNTIEVVEDTIARNNRDGLRIELIKNHHVGPGSSRQTGLEVAKGKYIYFADADDFMHPELLSLCVQSLDRSMADFVYFNYRNVEKYDPSTFETIGVSESKSISMDAKQFGEYYVHNSADLGFGYLWNKVFRADKIREWGIKFPAINTEEDAVFLFDLYAHSRRIEFLDYSLYQYVNNSASITHSRRDLQRFADNLRIRCDKCMWLLTDVWGFPPNALQARVILRLVVATIQLEIGNNSSLLTAARAWSRSRRDNYFQQLLKYLNLVPKMTTTADAIVRGLLRLKLDLGLVVLVNTIGKRK
jgi:glycosyltransferase involved in cell wall biosynthesis